jgi:hypothetical protein
VQGQADRVTRHTARARRFDGLASGGKDGEDTVADELAVDRCACVLSDNRPQRGVEIARFLAEGGVA